MRVTNEPTAGMPGAIAMAVYRPQPDLLREQVRSLAAQTVDDWRCHVGIDGTDEPTMNLVLELVGEDDRFVVHHFPDNVGFYRNFERLLARIDADAGWVALADQDDSWDADKLERLLAAFDSDASAMAVVGQARVVDADGALLGDTARRGVSLGSLIIDNQVTGSLAVFRPRVIEVGLPFPEPTPASYHDHWLGLVAACLGRIEVLDDLVQDYVQHSGNALGEEMSKSSSGRLASLAITSRDPRRMLDRLAIERWGWRQEMARTLVLRLRAGTLPREMHDFADGRLPTMTGHILRGMLARQVDRQRAAAIWVGCMWNRLAPGRVRRQDLEGRL